MVTRRTALKAAVQGILVGSTAVAAGPSVSARDTRGGPSTAPPPLPKGATILFQGDSITDGGRGRSPDPNHILGQDYAYLIAADCGGHFPEQDWTFLNRGVSGNTVKDLADRWQDDTLALKPDILSVLIGVNDVNSVVSGGGTGGVTAEEYEQVYRQILQDARAANPKLQIVLGQPFIEPGVHTTPQWALWSAEIKKRQAAVEHLAASFQAPVVPYQDVLDAAIKRTPDKPVEYWVWDGIHPTYAGHRLLADAWLRTVGG